MSRIYLLDSFPSMVSFKVTKENQLLINEKSRFQLNGNGFFSEPLVGFEPTTPRLQITCSGQLS